MKFTKEDTLFFKGIGILLIVFHNYFHWMPGFGLENEMGLSVADTKETLLLLSHFNFKTIITTLFSFFGHYGVQIFIVFSAYGLSIQYSKNKETAVQFVVHKLKKIYYLLFFAIIFCVVFFLIIGLPISFGDVVINTALLVSTLSSFTQATVFAMFSGPYWFFALIIQFYIIFPWLYKISGKPTTKRFLAQLFLSYLIIYPLYFYGESIPFTIFGIPTFFATFGSIIGHLPEVFLGVYLAKGGKLPSLRILLLPALIVFGLSQFYEFLFPLSFLLVSLLLIAFGRLLQRVKFWTATIHYVGVLSMMLFVVNGPLRNMVYSDLSKYSLPKWSGFLHVPTLLVYTLLLFVLSYVMNDLFGRGRKLLKL